MLRDSRVGQILDTLGNQQARLGLSYTLVRQYELFVEDLAAIREVYEPRFLSESPKLDQMVNVVPLRRRRGKMKRRGTTPTQGKRVARGTNAGGLSHSV